MAFDIVKDDFSKVAEIGYTFELKLPTGAPSGAKLTVIGEMSKTVKDYSRKKFAEWQQRQAIAKRKGKEAEELSLEEAEELSIESALVRLIGWEGITENGKEIPFSKEKAAQVLRDHPWIRDAIMQESADVTNFRPR